MGHYFPRRGRSIACHFENYLARRAAMPLSPQRRTLGDLALRRDRPRPPSLALDPGQAVLDLGLRPGTPRHGEELEPLLDEEVRSISGGMKYIPAAMPRFAAAAAILSSAR
jgi:hypothetical protein